MCPIAWYVPIGNVHWGLWARNISPGWGCRWYWCEGYWWIHPARAIIPDLWRADKARRRTDNIRPDGWCRSAFRFHTSRLYLRICSKNGWTWLAPAKSIWGRRFSYNGLGWRNSRPTNVLLPSGCIEWQHRAVRVRNKNNRLSHPVYFRHGKYETDLPLPAMYEYPNCFFSLEWCIFRFLVWRDNYRRHA